MRSICAETEVALSLLFRLVTVLLLALSEIALFGCAQIGVVAALAEASPYESSNRPAFGAGC